MLRRIANFIQGRSLTLEQRLTDNQLKTLLSHQKSNVEIEFPARGGYICVENIDSLIAYNYTKRFIDKSTTVRIKHQVFSNYQEQRHYIDVKTETATIRLKYTINL